MSATTPRYAFTYPSPTDATDIPDAIAIPLDQIDANVVMEYSGTLAARPAASIFGRRYYVTGDPTPANNGLEYMDTGTTWISVGPINTSAGNIAQQLPGAAAAAGNSGLSADSLHSHAREPVSTVADILPIGDTASAGNSGKWVDAAHVHAGGFSLGDFKQTANTSINYAGGPVNGFLPADGRLMGSTTGTYAAFYNACGGDASYPWGRDGLGNFYAPDTRDRILITAGISYTVGQKVGAANVQLSVANLPSHDHPLSNTSHNHGTTEPAAGHAHPSNAYDIHGGDFEAIYSSGAVGPNLLPGGPEVHIGGAWQAAMGSQPLNVTYFAGNTTKYAKTGLTVNNASLPITGTGPTTFSNTTFSVVQPAVGVITLVKVV